MKKTSKKLFISALLVMMLLLCINATSADDTLNQNLTISDNTANDIAEIANDEAVNAEDTADKLSASGDTYVVDANGGGDYTSISAAVSAATGGETILIKNGEYTENTITIKESVNIIGESQEGVKITGPTNSLFKGTTDKAIAVTFNNLTILNTGSGSNPSLLFTYSAHDINVINCTFDNCGSKWGTIQFGQSGTGVIDSCKILNSKDTANAGCGAIYMSNSGTYTIKNTVINNVQYTPTSSYMYGAIYSSNDNGVLNIENVSISNVSAPARGVIFAKGTLNVKGCKIQNNSLTKFSSNSNNIICLANNAKATVEQTVISDNVCVDTVFCNVGSGSKLTANYNNIHDNGASGIINSVGTIDLDANYWGSNTKPADVTATTWVVENNGEYKLNNGQPLEKTVPELTGDNNDETSDVIYVSTTGDDSKDGLSEANAVATLKHAIEISTGKIIILAGEYTQTEFLNITKDLDITGQGEVIIKSNVNEKVEYEEWDDWDEEYVTKTKTVNTLIENNANLNLTNIKFTLVPASISQELILNNANLLVNTAEFSNIKITSSRGVIQNTLNGKLEVNGTTFKTASGTYGAINNNGELLVNNSKFIDNDRSGDTGIYSTAITSYNKANIYNTVFNGNKGTAGGAVYVMYSYTIKVNPEMTIENCTFENNNAAGSAFTSGSGAAIKSSGNQVTLTVSNSTFIKNTASGSSANGGAIAATGTTTIDACVFKDNTATAGNSVYSSGTTTITNSIILDSGVAVDGSTVTANDNWWGTNDKPTNIGSGVTVDNWVTMDASMTPSQAQAGDEVTITATFSNDKLPDNVIDVTFTSTSGKLNEKVSVVDGKASVTYTIDAADTAINVPSSNAEVIINIEAPAQNTIYLSPNGDDGNDGLTKDTAVATITKAYELVPEDGVIYLLNGVHKLDEENNEWGMAGLVIEKPVSFVGESVENTIIDSAGKGYFLVDCEELDSLIFENITFDKLGAESTISVYANVAELNITNCKFAEYSVLAPITVQGVNKLNIKDSILIGGDSGVVYIIDEEETVFDIHNNVLISASRSPQICSEQGVSSGRIYENFHGNIKPSEIYNAGTLESYINSTITVSPTGDIEVDDVATVTIDFNSYTKDGNIVEESNLIPDFTINLSAEGTLSDDTITTEDGVATFTYTSDVVRNDEISFNYGTFKFDSLAINSIVIDRNIYVSPGASNSNPGTRDDPVGTIKHALEIAKGQIVLLEGVHKVDYLGIISDDLTITGEGNAVIDAQNNNRILYVGEAANVVINNVTMINGYTSDESGALLGNNNNLTLINCILANSSVGDVYNGGAIYNVGKLTVINTTVANCSARLGGAIFTNAGGSLAKENSIILINSTLENNVAYGDLNSGGGAIFAQQITELTIDNTLFINNEAQTASSGGAIFISHSDADVKITNSEFINNTAKNSGGAIYRAATTNNEKEGTMTITDTLFENNTCDGDGGAVYVRATTLNIANSVLINNKDASGLAVYGYKTDVVSPTVTLNDNWWGSNDSPKDLVGGNNYKPTLTRWAILTVENASEIKAGETVKLTISINKYTDGTSNGTLTNPIAVPRTAEFTTTSDEFSEVLENGELVYDYVIPTGLKYLAVTVDDETVVVYVVTTNITVIVDPVEGKKYDKVPVTVTVKAIDDSIVDMGEIELYVENKLIATLPVSEGNAIGEIVISQNDGQYNLTAKYVEKTGLFNTNQTNTTLTVSGIVELVNDTFYNFFDEEGILRDEITEDELIFHGDFSGLGVNIITIPRAITIKGDNAVLYNLSYALASNGIKLENITLVADGADFTLNNGAAIYANGENIEINNVTVNYTAPSDKEAFGIYANNANGFKLTGSEINFNGTNNAGLIHHSALILKESKDVEIKGNLINASLPARAIAYNYYYPQFNGIDQDLVLGIGIQGGENINFTDNKVFVDAKTAEGSLATLDSFMADSVKNLLIKNNNFTQTDFTGEGKAGYANCIDLYNFDGVTVEGNNILVNTTTGAEGAGTAYPIQATGPYTGLLIAENNLTAISKGPSLGIFSQNYDGTTDITVKSNYINVTGYATGNNYALVSGMELQDTNAKVYDNVIYSQSISSYDDANQLFGISYAQYTAGTHTFDIQNNTVYTEGKYAVYLRNANNAKVTENILHAHELVGDAAANISSGSGNVIKNNYPREVESITVEADTVFEGQTAVITVTIPNATGNVTIKLNGKDVATVELNENGTAVFETNEYEDVNTVNVTYNGNDKYYPISANTIFKYIGKIVTQENFYNYFDENGNLRSEIPYDELIFKGDFADLTPYITIERALTITGDDAKLENIGFIIAGEGVTLDKLELIASDLGDLITVAAPGATISNSNITYSAGEGNAIRAYYGADNLKIINNNIKFTSTLDDYDVETFANAISIDSGSDVYTRFDEDFIEGVVISNNNITAVIPSFTADAYEHEYYVMGLSSINGVRINGVTDLELTNNNINVTTNVLNGYTPTFQAVYIACADGIVNGNNISMIDTLTPEGKDVYLYAMEIIYDDLTISNNNFNISTKGGKADAGAAYAIQAVDSTIQFTKNNITAVSNGPNIGIYLPSRFGAPCDLTVTDNNIDVTGLATDKYTGLVTGIEVQTGKVVIKNNNITTHNIGSYDENNYIYGVSYAQKGTKGDFVITGNNITTDGHYTISFYEVDDAQVTGNYLISKDLTGDDSVEIKDGEDNTVKNNRPANPKLTVTVENIIIGTEAEIIITADETINGEVKVIINGEEHTVNITNGTGKLSVPDLAAGTYNVTAEYIGDNIEFVSASNNSSFTVNKLIISAEDIKLGESAIINITVNENITGEVKLIIDGKEYTVAITNGTGNLTVENLTASTYKVTAVYEGSDDFASAGNETTFKVNRLNTPVTITIGDAVIGENTVVNISVPGATGNVTVIVDGEETIIPLDADGNATYTIENITAGDHNIVAIYLGDDNNAANYNKTTISVDKLDTTLTIDPIETQTIDEPFTIKINNETPVTVTINGKEYAVDSEGNVIVDDLTAGDYIVNVVSAETGKYNANNATATFTVEKATPTVNIAIGEVVDDEVTVTVTLPDDATGTILINVNGTVFAFSTDDVNNGKIVLAAGKYNLLKASVTTTTPYTYQVVLTRAGEYKINATYLGDDKYTNASSETVTVNVAEKPQPVDTNVEVNVSDDKNSINIELPENATGNITVKVDGKEIYSGLANETENVPLGELPVGEHTVEVIYSGDENHTSKEVTETVNIEKTETEITADNVNITEGETATITVNVDSKATGLVLIDINGTKYYGEITDGKATVEVTGLTAGEYTADIKYIGDDKYANASTTAVINVTAKVVPVEPEKETPEANITVPEESKSGETPIVDVSLPEKATGNVTVVVDGKEVANVPLVNGSASIPLENMTAGVHDVEVKYSGDDNYAPVTASGNISVAKASPVITADVKDISECETATFTVTVPGDATGLVLVDINGAKYYGVIADGKATVFVPGLAAGEYTADIKYVGDNKYDNASASAKIKVTAKETPVTPDKVTPDANITIPSTANAGETPIVNIELPKDVTGNVSVIVDGKETLVPVVNGTASVPLENLTPGAHSVEVKYAGDDKYSPISEVSAIAVNDVIPTKKDTIILANATLTRVANDHTKMGENGTDYYVTLKDADGKPLFNKTIQIAINGVHYYVQTDEDGNAYQQVNMESANVYTYAFAFQGDDDYNAAPLNSTRLTVTKKPTTITAKAKSFKASAKTKKITVTLTTSKNPYDGKVYLAKGKKLTLTVNGKTYTGKTNAKNQVTFSIKLTKKGKYNAKVKFAGSKIYKATTKKVKITIK